MTDYLEAADGSRPLFLYVNIVDTHFPYYHGGIDDILGVPPLHRSEIRSHRAERVFKAYANTAANVDRAAEALVEAWRARIGGADRAILVFADHGEAFYEEGALRHGYSISPSERRVPMIVWEIGGEWPEPIAPTDIREPVRRSLGVERGASPPRARFVPDPTRSILQLAPQLRRPNVINPSLVPRNLVVRLPEGPVRADRSRRLTNATRPPGVPGDVSRAVLELGDARTRRGGRGIQRGMTVDRVF